MINWWTKLTSYNDSNNVGEKKLLVQTKNNILKVPWFRRNATRESMEREVNKHGSGRMAGK